MRTRRPRIMVFVFQSDDCLVIVAIWILAAL